MLHTSPLYNIGVGRWPKTIQDSMAGKQFLVWLDNFYGENYCSDSHNHNWSQNCITIADLPPSRRLDIYLSVPSLPLVWGYVVLRATTLCKAQDGLYGVVHARTANPVRLKEIRCPLDVRRTNMRSAQWQPFLLSPHRLEHSMSC